MNLLVPPVRSGPIVVSASSEAFFPYYLDLLDSLTEVGLMGEFSLGLIDLGLGEERLAQMKARGIVCVSPLWLFEQPRIHSGNQFYGFAAKPYLRELFPGYDSYVWLDADMWAQTPLFWEHLQQGLHTDTMALPLEVDADYRRASPMLWLWLLANFRRGLGSVAAARMVFAPLVNNACFALRADAPHWDVWRKTFERMVQGTQRLAGIDQLSLGSVLYRDRLPATLLPATDNWICSRGIPAWDAQQRRFVTPGESSREISMLHLTGPVRRKVFDVACTDGTVSPRYLHRPNGHVSAATAPATIAPETPAPVPQLQAA